MLEIIKDHPHFFERTVYKVEYVDVPDEEENIVHKVQVEFTDGTEKLYDLADWKLIVDKGKEILERRRL
jgi:phage baseplate assembly protein gpV